MPFLVWCLTTTWLSKIAGHKSTYWNVIALFSQSMAPITVLDHILPYVHSLVPSSSKFFCLFVLGLFLHAFSLQSFWFPLCQSLLLPLLPRLPALIQANVLYLSFICRNLRVCSWNEYSLSCLRSVFSLYNLNIPKVISGINLHPAEIFIWLITPSEFVPLIWLVFLCHS